ncbi:MAG TPA: DUF427 domain-containing protein [Micromonosporaceae bacterium]|jgi:uncharacterized protein (DUF427 family)
MATESVWDYPRPPRLEPTPREVRVVHHGTQIARTTGAFRVLETSHPPVYYLPPGDVRTDLLIPTSRHTFCEFKGVAHYVDLVLPDDTIREAAWYYPDPIEGFEDIAGYFAFYASQLDECTVAGERVTAQDGEFYGGWITSDIVGPFRS